MVYFNDKLYRLDSKEEADQCGQVLEFKKNFPKEGTRWPYKGKNDFERLLRQHLNDFLFEKLRTRLIQAGAAAAVQEAEAGNADGGRGV